MNFRLRISSDGDADKIQSLKDFLAENEGIPAICAQVEALEPGQHIDVMSGLVRIKRFNKSQARYARFKVPIKFDGAQAATITIDRHRLTLSIRPLRRRTSIELPLQQLAEQYLVKAAKIAAIERIKARRAKRLARRA